MTPARGSQQWHLTASGLAIAVMLVALLLPWRVPDSETALIFGDPETYPSDVVMVGLAALFIAVGALVLRASSRWPALLAALLLAALAIVLIAGGMPRTGVCWDGQDSEGRPVGDCYYLVPGPGAWLALGAAIVGLLSTVAAVVQKRLAVSSQPRGSDQRGSLDEP